MKILVDTHIAIWAINDDPQLSQDAKRLLLDEENEIYFSVVTVWEIAIKHMNHPREFPLTGKCIAENCAKMGFVPLPVLLEHVQTVETLHLAENAPRHKDPFDRMLIAQAKAAGMKLMTHDSLIPYYNEECILAI